MGGRGGAAQAAGVQKSPTSPVKEPYFTQKEPRELAARAPARSTRFFAPILGTRIPAWPASFFKMADSMAVMAIYCLPLTRDGLFWLMQLLRRNLESSIHLF